MARTLKQRKYALIFPPGEGRTEEAHAGETNINTIMARAMRGDHVDFANKHEPQYGDATRGDFMQASIIVANANSMFEELPANLRSKFHHDPSEFLEFVQDPKNKEEMVKLKLSKKTLTIVPPEDEKQQQKPPKSDGTSDPEESTKPPSDPKE